MAYMAISKVMGAPLNHQFYFRIFHEINHPAIGVPIWLRSLHGPLAPKPEPPKGLPPGPDQSMNQWINHWTNESVNQWTIESMHHWINEWATFLRRATSSLSDLFAEAPLLSATSSHYPGYLCSDLPPASSPVDSATHLFSLRSCYNAVNTLQLQSRLPGVSQHHSCFPARSRANMFCHNRLQARIARASHQINQHLRRVKTTQIPGCSETSSFLRFLDEIELSLQSRAHLADHLFQKCS